MLLSTAASPVQNSPEFGIRPIPAPIENQKLTQTHSTFPHQRGTPDRAHKTKKGREKIHDPFHNSSTLKLHHKNATNKETEGGGNSE